MIYGYCRVSTKEQNLDRQTAALTGYKKLDRIYSDKQSGKDFCRDAYQQLKSVVVAGDEVVVKELDRLGRNKEEVKAELEWFKHSGVVVRILDVPTTLIDFRGQDWIADMVNNVLIEVLGAVAEQERKKIRARQAEGIQAKKDRGEWADYGRPKKVVDGEEFKYMVSRWEDGFITVAEACEKLRISRTKWYELLKEGDVA